MLKIRFIVESSKKGKKWEKYSDNDNIDNSSNTTTTNNKTNNDKIITITIIGKIIIVNCYYLYAQIQKLHSRKLTLINLKTIEITHF